MRHGIKTKPSKNKSSKLIMIMNIESGNLIELKEQKAILHLEGNGCVKLNNILLHCFETKFLNTIEFKQGCIITSYFLLTLNIKISLLKKMNTLLATVKTRFFIYMIHIKTELQQQSPLT